MNDWLMHYFGFILLIAIALISGMAGFFAGGVAFGLIGLPAILGAVIGAILIEGAAVSYAIHR